MNGWRTLFPNAYIIAVRDYKSRVSGRSFKIGTLLLVLLGFAAAQGPVVVDFISSQVRTKVEVYAQTADVPANYLTFLDTQLNGSSAVGGSTTRAFDVVAAPSDLTAAKAAVDRGDYGALLIVDRAANKDLTFVLRTDFAPDSRQGVMLQGASIALANADRLARAGVSLNQQVGFDFQGIKQAAKPTEPVKSQDEEISRSLMLTGFIVLIFMAIITYGTWVAMSVAEEKSSRVMELMLNTTTPLQMLAGKVLGNGAAGLTQYGLVVVAAIAGLFASGPIREKLMGTSTSTPLGGLDPIVLLAFLVLFLLGFTLYSLLYAALGSLVSRQEDVQSATSPLMMLIMVGYFVAIFGVQAVNEAWVVALSYIPFFTPYIMLARIAIGHVEIWEFVVVVGIMFVTICAAVFVAARIYSAGVLLYGQRVGLRQIFRAARVSR